MLYSAIHSIILCYTTFLIPSIDSRFIPPPFNQQLQADGEKPHAVCFKQPPFPQPRAARVELDECEAAHALILIGDKIDAPMDFSTDAATGYKVPKVWGCGGCQIILYTTEQDSPMDTFSLAYVAWAASEIIDKCVRTRPAQIGGDAKVGPKKIFKVVVAGTIKPANDACAMPRPGINLTIPGSATNSSSMVGLG